MDVSGEAKPTTRLDGWGEIARHLKKDVRTVQRWEKLYPDLPIHRDASPKPRVWAFTDELDKWWLKQDVEATAAATPEAQQSVSQPAQPGAAMPSTRALLVFFGALLSAISAAVIGLSRLPPPGPQPRIVDRIFARVDAESGTAKVIPVAGSPTRMLLSPSGDEIYILGMDGAEIQVFDLADLRVIERISTPGVHNSVALAPDGNTIYVGMGSGELRIIDRKRKTSRVAPDCCPAAIRDLALSRDGKQLYMAIYRSGLRRYDTATGRTTVLSSTGCAESLALDDAHQRLFVGYLCGGIGGSIAHDTVDMMNPATGERSVAFRGPPMVAGPLFLFPSGENVWINGLDACKNPQYLKYDLSGCPPFPGDIHHIFRVSDSTLVKTLTAPAHTLAAPAIMPDGKRAVISGRPVRVLETGTYTEIETFDRDNLIFGVPPVFDLKRNRLYLATAEPGQIHVVDLPTGDCDYPSQNLQHQWTGDGTYNDRTGRAFASQGAVSFAPGLVGRCFRLQQASLSFATPYSSLHGLTIREGTLQAWVNLQDVVPGSSLFELTANRRVVWRLGTEILPVADGWHHIAAVVRGGKLTVFVDGAVISETVLPKASPLHPTRLTIGPLNGLVDEVAVHDRPFDTADLINLARRTRTCISGTKN